MGDEYCQYADPDTGKTYDLAYDVYFDPERFIVRSASSAGRRVRITPELRTKFVRAARAAYCAMLNKSFAARGLEAHFR